VVEEEDANDLMGEVVQIKPNSQVVAVLYGSPRQTLIPSFDLSGGTCCSHDRHPRWIPATKIYEERRDGEVIW
jgi:hypothetical protein